MRTKLSMLAVSILAGCSSINDSSRVTQADLDYVANNIIIRPSLVENKPDDCPKNSPWGFCFRQQYELTNTGNQALNKNVEIYFGSLFPILEDTSTEFNVEHVNGDLHRITMTDKFSGLKAGGNKNIHRRFPKLDCE